MGNNQNTCTDPLTRCSLYGAALAATGINDVSIITHAPQGCDLAVGCAYSYTNVDYMERYSACSRICESEVVNGGEKKLYQTLEIVTENYPHENIVVLTGCASEIIGDDVDAICNEASKKMNINVIPIMAGGFHGNQNKGIDIALKTLLKKFVGDRKPFPGSVNLIAPFASANPGWIGDLNWVKRVLEKMDIKINAILTHRNSIMDFRSAANAQANILLSLDSGFEAAEFLEKEYGIPLLCRNISLPIGLAGTRRWVEEIADFFGQKNVIADFLDNEENRVIKELTLRFLPIHIFHGQQTAISGDYTLGTGLLEFVVNELEMDVQYISTRPSNGPLGKEILDLTVKRMGISPDIYTDIDLFNYKALLEKYNLKSVFGSLVEDQVAQTYDLNCVYKIFDKVGRIDYFDYPYFGHDGILKLIEIIVNEWKNNQQFLSKFEIKKRCHGYPNKMRCKF